MSDDFLEFVVSVTSKFTLTNNNKQIDFPPTHTHTHTETHDTTLDEKKLR